MVRIGGYSQNPYESRASETLKPLAGRSRSYKI